MIRRILLLILIPVLATTAISCDDLEDNTPALQVMVNGELFKAEDMQVATEENGGYTLTGINGNSALNVYLSNVTEGSYKLGEGSENVLLLKTEDGEFTTAHENGGGEVMITDAGILEYISGTFHFTAVAIDTSGVKMRGSNGNFYQVSFGAEDMELPDGAFDNKATLLVEGVTVNVTDVNARLVDEQIEIVVIGDNDQRFEVKVKQSVEVGELTLPDDNVFMAYLLDGNSDEVTSGVFNVTVHEAEELQHLRVNFEGTTENGHEVSGSFQVNY